MSEDEIFLTHILHCRPVDLLLNRPALSPEQEQEFHNYKRRRQNGEPLQYIIGSWDFYGLEFKVDPSVLVPRPETEVLVDLAIKRFLGVEILDLGTGSGNIAVTLAKNLPYSRITAVETSVEAMVVAMGNAQVHGVEGRIEWVNTDMMEYLSSCRDRFDLIISNPPYIPSAEIKQLPKDVQQEPLLALDGGADGLGFYREIIKYSPALLTPKGYLMMEFGDGQENAIADMAKDQFAQVEVHKDLAGRPRIIICK